MCVGQRTELSHNRPTAMTFSHEDNRSTVEARVDARLKERVQEFADDESMSQSDVLREALDEYLPDDEPGDGPRIKPPATEELRNALKTLQKLARNTDGRIPEETALSQLAQETGHSKDSCRMTLLTPLVDEGYVKRAGGFRGETTLRIILPSDVDEIVAREELQTASD